jgi:integrase/recombinase XerD
VNALDHALARWCKALAIRGQTVATVRTRQSAIGAFNRWCGERGIESPSAVTPALIERYQRHLFHYRAPEGAKLGRGVRRGPGNPLSTRTQHGHLTAVRLFFRWLARERWIAYNPASELDLPRLPQRLPRAILTVEEVEAVLAATTRAGDMGVRDRAMLETLYATGIRRNELAGLSLYDVDTRHGTLMVREGKGRKDRLLPIGERACRWIEKYTADVRPALLIDANEKTLFLAYNGHPFVGESLGAVIRRYLDAAGIAKPGACHLFRHTMATAMLDNGADIRFIQTMLGHANIETTTVYTRVSMAKLREVYERTHPAKAARTARNDDAEAMRAAVLDALDAEAGEESDAAARG